MREKYEVYACVNKVSKCIGWKIAIRITVGLACQWKCIMQLKLEKQCCRVRKKTRTNRTRWKLLGIGWKGFSLFQWSQSTRLLCNRTMWMRMRMLLNGSKQCLNLTRAHLPYSDPLRKRVKRKHDQKTKLKIVSGIYVYLHKTSFIWITKRNNIIWNGNGVVYLSPWSRVRGYQQKKTHTHTNRS